MKRRKASLCLLGVLVVPSVFFSITSLFVSFRWQFVSPDPRPKLMTIERQHTWRASHESNSTSYYRMPLPVLVATDTPQKECPDGMHLRRDRHFDNGDEASDRWKIPRIIHQTSKSRCLTKIVFDLTGKWQLNGWDYYLHDDDAIQRLFDQEAIHFPLLPVIAKHCLLHGTLKADLWRYLVLWVYGGIYADLDTAPNTFVHDTISPRDDALFVVEQYHMLSQYFMAVSPRHPLMWYAIQRCLQNLWQLPDTGRVVAAKVTGPHALHMAYIDFRKDAGERIDPVGAGNKPVWAGHFHGTFNYTVTVIGFGENQNEYIHRDLLGRHNKNAAYKQMHMRHFQEDMLFPTGDSCLSAILKNGQEW